eukprot:TRINITY_DN32612_c0_g1_i2.p1 TRINITY_DN32612_c0_g1~~TRINITY_DN32612_c0_g1_i2.p1  ORF type:complete len:229 (+),score=49.59 TRINITY_DN32612_c0_g1_i2:159-845(+)
MAKTWSSYLWSQPFAGADVTSNPPLANSDLLTPDLSSYDGNLMNGNEEPNFVYEPGAMFIKAVQEGDVASYKPGELLAASAQIGQAGQIRQSRILPSATLQTAPAALNAWQMGAGYPTPPGLGLPQPSEELEAPHNLQQADLPLPSIGSAGHEDGNCKPCAFLFKDGCQSGHDCQFCHLCEEGEKRRRKKESKMRRRASEMMTAIQAGLPFSGTRSSGPAPAPVTLHL